LGKFTPQKSLQHLGAQLSSPLLQLKIGLGGIAAAAHQLPLLIQGGPPQATIPAALGPPLQTIFQQCRLAWLQWLQGPQLAAKP
jgi:hypothetical protein